MQEKVSIRGLMKIKVVWQNLSTVSKTKYSCTAQKPQSLLITFLYIKKKKLNLHSQWPHENKIFCKIRA